jgi:hypothetical protein
MGRYGRPRTIRISQRRGLLGPGMIEASMMIKLNKDRIIWDPALVEEHRKTWKALIPKRLDSPADYYDEPEEEDVDNDDGSITRFYLPNLTSPSSNRRRHPSRPSLHLCLVFAFFYPTNLVTVAFPRLTL